MTQITDATPTAARNNDARIISLVCAAHFVSHFYILVLPPLFPFIREFYGVSYTRARPRADRVQRHHRAVPDAGRLPGRPDRRALGAGRRPGARRGLPRGRRARSRRSGCWSRCSRCSASRTASTTRPTTRSCRNSSRTSARARPSRCTSSRASSAPRWRPPRMLILQQALGWQGAFLAASVMGLLVAIALAAAAGRAVRAAAEAGAAGERSAEGRQGRLVAAAVGADPAQSAVLRDDHLLDHRRAELFGRRAERGLSARRSASPTRR